MLIFFDETFRTAQSGHRLGALCGIAIPEDLFDKITADVYYMKYSSFGEQFAKERELKGSKLLKKKNFRKLRDGSGSSELEFVRDLLRFLLRQKLISFGVISFDTELSTFKCKDPHRLELSYRILFDRIDSYMKRVFPNRRAKLIFDDVDYGSNRARAESVTNFFMRSTIGRGYDSIIRTPFFAVSQAQNTGIQLADLVTTICGMRFEGNRDIYPHWAIFKKTIYQYRVGSVLKTTLKVFKE